jgi:hypothetical protein
LNRHSIMLNAFWTALGNRARVLWIVLLICATGGLPGPAAAESGDGPQKPPRIIRLVCISDTMPGVDTEDARMAMEMLMRNVWGDGGRQFRIQLDFVDFGQIAQKIVSERHDMAILPALDYLQFRDKVPLIPRLVLSRVDAPTEALVLVTQRDETFETLANKKQRVLMLDMGRGGEGARMWLDTVLLEAHLGSTQQFFTEIRRAPKASRSILPVFFGQAAACVVPESALMVMKELNPQIGRRLRVIRRSESLAALLLCATPWADQGDIDLVVSSSNQAMNDPKSQQALTMVQMNRFFRFEPAYLAATENLYKRFVARIKRGNR